MHRACEETIFVTVTGSSCWLWLTYRPDLSWVRHPLHSSWRIRLMATKYNLHDVWLSTLCIYNSSDTLVNLPHPGSESKAIALIHVCKHVFVQPLFTQDWTIPLFNHSLKTNSWKCRLLGLGACTGRCSAVPWPRVVFVLPTSTAFVPRDQRPWRHADYFYRVYLGKRSYYMIRITHAVDKLPEYLKSSS